MRAPGCDGMSFETQLGVDLWTLAASRDSPFATVTGPRRPAGAGRGTFRLGFADGSILKGRRCEGEIHAARVERFSTYLDPRYFPPVVKRHASALLEEWVVGDALTPRAGEEEMFRCGG